MHTRGRTHTYSHARARTHTHIHMHTHTSTHPHTQIRTHAHAHNCTYYLCQNCTIDQVAKLIELTTSVDEPGLAPHSSQWLIFGQRHSIFSFIFIYLFILVFPQHTLILRHTHLAVGNHSEIKEKKDACNHTWRGSNSQHFNWKTTSQATRPHMRTHIQLCCAARELEMISYMYSTVYYCVVGVRRMWWNCNCMLYGRGGGGLGPNLLCSLHGLVQNLAMILIQFPLYTHMVVIVVRLTNRLSGIDVYRFVPRFLEKKRRDTAFTTSYENSNPYYILRTEADLPFSTPPPPPPPPPPSVCNTEFEHIPWTWTHALEDVQFAYGFLLLPPCLSLNAKSP